VWSMRLNVSRSSQSPPVNATFSEWIGKTASFPEKTLRSGVDGCSGGVRIREGPLNRSASCGSMEWKPAFSSGILHRACSRLDWIPVPGDHELVSVSGFLRSADSFFSIPPACRSQLPVPRSLLRGVGMQ